MIDMMCCHNWDPFGDQGFGGRRPLRPSTFFDEVTVPVPDELIDLHPLYRTLSVFWFPWMAERSMPDKH